MSSYRLTHKAAEDLASIYTFSFERFGESKADAYLMALEERFILLAQNPALGQRIDFIRSGFGAFIPFPPLSSFKVAPARIENFFKPPKPKRGSRTPLSL